MGGLMRSKGLSLTKKLPNGDTRTGSASMGYWYTDQGQLGSVTFPAYWAWEALPTGYNGWVQHSGWVYDYTLDTLGRPVKLVRPRDGTVWADAVSYGAAGEITSIKYPEKLWNPGVDVPYYRWYTETRSYNALGQMTRMQAVGDSHPTYRNPPAPPVDYEYRYGAANDGRIAQRKDWITGEEINYQYDTLGRLSLAETTGPEWGMRFGYDGFGNLTGETATKGTGFTTTYNHDGNNHLIGGYGYDANGNLTSMPALTLTYDIENRVTQSVHTTNGTEQYVYNPWNERAWRKAANGSESVYIYGPDGRLAAEQAVEIDSYGVMRLTHLNQELRLAGKLLRSDALGGEVIEDRIGTAKAKDYYPYGELKAGATATQFATYRRGASGLDYAINRYYASQVGRFTTPDPYGGSAHPDNPQSWNRYAYAGNDPVNGIDPAGLDWYSAGLLFPIFVAPPTSVTVTASVSPLEQIFIRDMLGAIGNMTQYAAAYSTSTALMQAAQHAKKAPRPTPADLARAQMAAVAPLAKGALGKSDCLNLFGTGDKDPAAILTSMISHVAYKDARTDYTAKYNTMTGSLTVNTHTGPEGTYWNTPWHLQTTENAVTMLHELGHATSSNNGNRFLDDTSLIGRSNGQKSWANDSLIWTNCFGLQNPFPKPKP